VIQREEDLVDAKVSLARNVWVDSISARFFWASLRNAPFRKITMKAFTSKKAANERASEKGLVAARTFPVGQAGCREVVGYKGHREYETREKKEIS
jgi:hypothetical protein